MSQKCALLYNREEDWLLYMLLSVLPLIVEVRGSFKKYVDNVAVERKNFLKIKFNTWKDAKSYILSTSDVSAN